MKKTPLELLTTDGFIDAFEEKAKETLTKEAAFEAVNNEFRHFFHRPRYSNYDSFRQIRNRRLKSSRLKS